MDRLTTAAWFSHPHEAWIARAPLEAAGIPSFVFDENIVNIDWFYSNAVGGVRLMVPSGLLAQARETLARAGDDFEIEPDADVRRCPECGDDRTERSPGVGFTALMAAVLFMGAVIAFPAAMVLFFFPYFRLQRRCNNCGHHWRIRRRARRTP